MRFTIDTDGDVGIATTSPTGFTHLYTDQRYILYLESTYGTDRKYWFRNDGGTQLVRVVSMIEQATLPLIPNNEFGIGTRGPRRFY